MLFVENATGLVLMVDCWKNIYKKYSVEKYGQI